MLLVYRLLVTCYISGWTLYLFILIPKTGEHPTLAYFTQWAYLLLLSYQAAGLAVLLYHTKWSQKTKQGTSEDNDSSSDAEAATDELLSERDAEETEMGPDSSQVSRPGMKTGNDVMTSRTLGDNLTWDLKSMWLLHSMASVCGLAVSLIYLCVLLPMVLSLDVGYIPSSLDLNLHVINSCIILLDCFLTAIPTRVLHAIYPVSFAFLYIVFSAVYWAIDKKRNVLYPAVLDWNDPGRTMAAVLGANCVMLPLLQFLLFGVSSLRTVVCKKCYGQSHLSGARAQA